MRSVNISICVATLNSTSGEWPSSTPSQGQSSTKNVVFENCLTLSIPRPGSNHPHTHPQFSWRCLLFPDKLFQDKSHDVGKPLHISGLMVSGKANAGFNVQGNHFLSLVWVWIHAYYLWNLSLPANRFQYLCLINMSIVTFCPLIGSWIGNNNNSTSLSDYWTKANKNRSSVMYLKNS
jgi:hypothetical protein